MTKSNNLNRNIFLLFSLVTVAIFWLILDQPIDSGRKLNGVVKEVVYVPARYSNYTRVVVRLDNGLVVTFQYHGFSQFKPSLHVQVTVLQRRLSKLNSYDLN
jgi:hypothetical protein